MKLLVTLIFALLLLSKCAPSLPAQSRVKSDPNHEYPRICTFVEVGQSAEKTFGVEFDFHTANFPYDSLYILPPVAHVQQMEKFRQKRRLQAPWSPNSNDCDDQAREALYFAKVWSHLNYKEVPATVAYGSAYVRIVGNYPLGRGMGASPSQPSYHVLNVYLRNDGVWFFFEPQNGRSEEALSLIYEGVVEVMRVEL